MRFRHALVLSGLLLAIAMDGYPQGKPFYYISLNNKKDGCCQNVKKKIDDVFITHNLFKYISFNTFDSFGAREELSKYHVIIKGTITPKSLTFTLDEKGTEGKREIVRREIITDKEDEMVQLAVNVFNELLDVHRGNSLRKNIGVFIEPTPSAMELRSEHAFANLVLVGLDDSLNHHFYFGKRFLFGPVKEKGTSDILTVQASLEQEKYFIISVLIVPGSISTSKNRISDNNWKVCRRKMIDTLWIQHAAQKTIGR